MLTAAFETALSDTQSCGQSSLHVRSAKIGYLIRRALPVQDDPLLLTETP
jgi:hypothetical protein